MVFHAGPGAKASPTSHSYFSQRLRLHYLDWGNEHAPPLLLIHGNRDHCHNWDWVAERLRDDYHIIAPDLRGHGDSQWSTGSTYSTVEYVYDIAQLVTQRQLAPCRIVAHSLGGNVALKYAGVYPEHVEKLVVIEGYGPAPTPVDEELEPREQLRQWITAGRALSGREPRRYRSLEEAYERMQEANQHLTPDQARHLTIHGSNQNEDGTYSWKFDNYTHVGTPYDMPLDVRAELWGNITCPVLLISGSESWAKRDEADVAALTGHFRRAASVRHELIERAGHWVHHDRLDYFVTLVGEFLADDHQGSGRHC
ncbi:MAG: alpha/beta fold hydrolase [Acidimicrobiales bacterium]